jgi:L-alanine-DL-glutamate epimerase-like enolase superfamily enzyme
VYAESALPLVADESCVVEADVERCADHFHGVNVKLCKCGGLTPARRMLEHARRLGLKTMIGCMTETTVGVSALAQLLPLTDYADLDGPLLLARDVAQGVTFERGVVHYADAPGTGAGELEIAD